MYNITSPLANLPGKPLNIIHAGSEEKWVKAPNKPKHAVYVASTGGGKLHIVGNINAKSVYIDKGVKVSGAITAETDIRISAGVEFVTRADYPLVAGGNIIIGEPSYGGDSPSDRAKLYVLGGLLAGGDLFIGEDVELNTCQVIVSGDIILDDTGAIELYPIERAGKKLPLEPKYLCGGKIYMHPKTHYRPISLNKDAGWSIVHPYNKDTPGVCLKNGARMRGGGERIPCASTIIYSNEVKNESRFILPAPDAEQAVPYTSPIGLPPAYKAQMTVHRKALWLVHIVEKQNPFGLNCNILAEYMENNLQTLLDELSLLAQLKPDVFNEQEVKHEYAQEVSATIAVRVVHGRDIESFATDLVQAIADVDSKHFDMQTAEPEETGLKTWFKSLF